MHEFNTYGEIHLMIVGDEKKNKKIVCLFIFVNTCTHRGDYYEYRMSWNEFEKWRKHISNTLQTPIHVSIHSYMCVQYPFSSFPTRNYKNTKQKLKYKIQWDLENLHFDKNKCVSL